MYNILVVGAGYVGSAIAEYYVEKQQRVFAITRSKEKSEKLATKEIQPICADLKTGKGLELVPKVHFVVIAVAPDERSEEAYYETYVLGVRKLLQTMTRHPDPMLVVYLSSTGIWDQPGLDWVNEEVPVKPVSKRAKILARAEQQVLEFGYPAVILRLSGIYGPGRHRLKTLKEKGMPDLKELKYMNMIHREDIVGAMPYLFRDAKEGEVYTLSDDYPVSNGEFYSWIMHEKHKELSLNQKDVKVKGKRLSNEKIKKLGFLLKYPTYKEGYRAIVAETEV